MKYLSALCDNRCITPQRHRYVLWLDKIIGERIEPSLWSVWKIIRQKWEHFVNQNRQKRLISAI